MRQFVSETFPDKKGILTVSGKNFRYFKQVLRFKVGDMVNVRLPDGNLIETTLCKINEDEKRIFLQVCNSASNISSEGTNSSDGDNGENFGIGSNGISISLFQFVPKSSKMDLIVRQATECGVARIIPLKGDFSQQFEKDYRNERLTRIIREARQQSGSPVATEIFNSMSVEEAINFWKNISAKESEYSSEESKSDGFTGIVLYERGNNTVSIFEAVGKILKNEKAEKCPKEIAIVTGGEGGISPSEIEKFSENGFIIVHFDTNILRCETAALYGIASLQTLLTEKNKWRLNE